MKRILSCAALFIATSFFQATAQTATDANEGSRLEYDSANQIYRFKWWGHGGSTYFIQHSEDLTTWNWVPVVESGGDAVKEYGFTTTGTKFFARLKFTTAATSDPEGGDFDGDGLSNLAEVQQGLNPLSNDTDGDTLLDGGDPAPTVPNKAPVIGAVQEQTTVAGSALEVAIPATDSDGDLSLLKIESIGYHLQSAFDTLPAGGVLIGQAQLLAGEMQLTAVTGSLVGTFVVPGPAAGESFRAKFDLFIGDGSGADGFCFAYGPLADGEIAAGITEAFIAENTLSVQFDTFSNGGQNGYDDEANTIEVWYGTERLAKAQVTLRTASFVPVEIIQNGGGVTVKHNGQTVLENIPLPGSPLAPGTAMRLGFGARIGGYTDRHAIDNLDVATDMAEWTWVESGTRESAFAPPVASGQRTLRMLSDVPGGRKVTLVGRDATGLESRKEVRFAVVATATSTSDTDGDGLSDAEETALGTSPTLADTNGDGLWDGAAVRAGGTALALSPDSDGDGISNAAEVLAGTNPLAADSDGDGVEDDADAYPLDPLRSDGLVAVPGDVTAPEITLSEPDILP